ncbi:recombinase family protein [Variovorax sp. WS11]|uniref:recombinase family protein n=1 Tax=Variovorax sp. WS11 TaxID=1105204 RepID=UPI001EF1BD7C|nr:recombinase family protein [Variovorax sp. WS11]
MLIAMIEADPTLMSSVEACDEHDHHQAHLSKPAYIYVRQSTPGQVRHNQESTERQYALQDKARAMGWPQVDPRAGSGPGPLGAQIAGREDFKTLVADVSMSQVGAVFALEVSRLARFEPRLASAPGTVCPDAHPGDRYRWLLRPRGLQRRTGARNQGHDGPGRTAFLARAPPGGKLNKAQKGELRFLAGRLLL